MAKALALSPGYSDALDLAATLAAGKSYEAYINDSLTFYYAGDFQKSVEAAQHFELVLDGHLTRLSY